MKPKLYLTLLFLLLSVSLRAQTLFPQTLLRTGEGMLSPALAAAGGEGRLWIGHQRYFRDLPGTPQFSYVQAEWAFFGGDSTSLYHKSYHGFSAQAMNLQFGVFRESGLRFGYAFHRLLDVQNGNPLYASLGMQTRLQHLNIDQAAVLTENEGDPTLLNFTPAWFPALDVALSLRNRHFFAAFTLRNAVHGEAPEGNPHWENASYQLASGTRFPITEGWYLRVAGLWDIQTSDMQAQMRVGLRYKNMLEVASGYATGGRWQLALGYTHPTFGALHYAFGPRGGNSTAPTSLHEITLGFRMLREANPDFSLFAF